MSFTLREQAVPYEEDGTLSTRLARWARDLAPDSKWIEGEPLTRHSSLRIGGEAKAWIEVGTASDLLRLLAALGDAETRCVGLGSNSLFPDEGVVTPLLRFVGDMASWFVTGESGDEATVQVMAGAVNAHLVRGLMKSGWVGVEFLSLIPGTFGGAVALNAGTKEKELQEVLTMVWLAIPDNRRRRWEVLRRTPEELDMGYRHASLAPGAMVLGGEVRVRRGDVESARTLVREDKERRNRTQPYRLASVGSTFANPPGDYAGRLIEAVGLKGFSVGGAQVSPLHANFFINEGGATAEDFLSLMALARHRVRRDFGVELRPEVRFVGFDGWARMLALEEEWKDRDV